MYQHPHSPAFSPSGGLSLQRSQQFSGGTEGGAAIQDKSSTTGNESEAAVTGVYEKARIGDSGAG